MKNLEKKTLRMLNSKDPELIALAVSIIIERIEDVTDYNYVKGYINKIPPYVGRTFGQVHIGLRYKRIIIDPGVRQRLRIQAQKKYFETIKKK